MLMSFLLIKKKSMNWEFKEALVSHFTLPVDSVPIILDLKPVSFTHHADAFKTTDNSNFWVINLGPSLYIFASASGLQLSDGI